jgi:deferrochelatase/peroxidase EfeB
MSAKPTAALELDDIQAGALQPRPASYAGIYQMLRLDDRHAGREMRRLIPYLDSVASFDPKSQVSLAVALSFQGLKALGVPEESLASFPPEFQQGMAERACELGDVGENAPEHWEKPLGSQDLHIVLVGLAPDTARLEAAVRHAREALRDLAGVVPIWQQDVYSD